VPQSPRDKLAADQADLVAALRRRGPAPLNIDDVRLEMTSKILDKKLRRRKSSQPWWRRLLRWPRV
jgi:hypothetical protein